MYIFLKALFTTVVEEGGWWVAACSNRWRGVKRKNRKKKKREEEEEEEEATVLSEWLAAAAAAAAQWSRSFSSHGYDWQRQQSFTRACPHTRSVVAVTTERPAAWRVQREPGAAAALTQEQQRVSESSGSYLLLLFTRRGRINKVCNWADCVRVSRR